ncbi:sigma-70 family RNA polymerase sigma factor [Mucilaginibacter paludis]|uniref:RNA polymerase, sigma-24 subunit, ECF subfamily n=1 Tax=Mucilaginibacter paludis DSM 18603 TaxID=714943 RepID=H1YBP6_9SPHI|nr:sigma-70 family RNA polymerase sigma factor [Mucilaginibacter paludis]EHQ26009.1 RNA polymerase, sigma-24 subunit, ECF subfamily [Mucilaginibacter paludis DSM 18603]
MQTEVLRSCSDEVLLEMIRLEGNHLAFTTLYDRYWNKLLAIAYNLLRDKSSAKEIVQEVFISLWNRRTNIEVRNAGSYLATAVKFSVFKQIERERRYRHIELADVGDLQLAAVDDRIEDLFIKEYLAGLLEALPEKCALVINYSRIRDWSNAQIAEELNIAEKTVEGHLTKGLKLIRANLKASGMLSLLTASATWHLFR